MPFDNRDRGGQGAPGSGAQRRRRDRVLTVNAAVDREHTARFFAPGSSSDPQAPTRPPMTRGNRRELGARRRTLNLTRSRSGGAFVYETIGAPVRCEAHAFLFFVYAEQSRPNTSCDLCPFAQKFSKLFDRSVTSITCRFANNGA